MAGIWDELKIDATDDLCAIRQAYAQRLNEVPEVDPDGLQRLRTAYEAALTWAENVHDTGVVPPAPPGRPKPPLPKYIKHQVSSFAFIAIVVIAALCWMDRFPLFLRALAGTTAAVVPFCLLISAKHPQLLIRFKARSQVFLGVFVLTISFAITGFSQLNVSSANIDRMIAKQRQARVPSGAMIRMIPWASKAHWYGLEPGDIITNYDGDPVRDYTTYRAASENRAVAGVRKVRLTIMRSGEPKELIVSSGLPGVTMESWTFMRDTIIELARANDIDAATGLVEQAAREESMSIADLLISKIHLISDRDTSQAAVRKKLVNDLSTHLTLDGMAFVGSQIFFPSKQFQASAMLLERAAVADPKDIAVKNHLALTYAVMGRFHDAEHLADQVMKLPQHELTDFAWSVAHKTKGYVYQARGQFELAADLLQRAVEESANFSDPNLRRRYLLNLARLRDLNRFETGVAYCTEHPGDGFLDGAHYVDALRAYLLSAIDRRQEALEIVEKWRKNAEVQRQILEYWSETPGGEPVIFKWKELSS